ncbi:hypothetical protein VNI00_015797 [Paramarasmius palmivorus]|uniref:Uncharacterized protein n=1 Tax=Paramarasmius palmivorus TaxID=297713 RepID=A0AAW0BIH8_9AGAR
MALFDRITNQTKYQESLKGLLLNAEKVNQGFLDQRHMNTQITSNDNKGKRLCGNTRLHGLPRQGLFKLRRDILEICEYVYLN